VLCIPGNHDIPEAMSRQLCEPPFRICGTHQLDAWQFVMLDSYDPGHVGGRLTPAELARLDAALANSECHTMVCLHHHPIAMNSRWLDGIGLANTEEFWRIIDAHAHVKAVVWGHVHQAYEGTRGAVRLFATPSTGAQFLPASDRYAVDARPPAYRSFDLHADGGIETQVHWVEALPARQVAAR
jgi:Icc protein